MLVCAGDDYSDLEICISGSRYILEKTVGIRKNGKAKRRNELIKDNLLLELYV